MYETGLEVNMTINTEFEAENNCKLDEFRWIFQFIDIFRLMLQFLYFL